MTDIQIFGAILVGVGLIELIAFVLLRRRSLYLYRNGAITTAVVTKVARRSGEAGTSYSTDVSFAVPNGDSTSARMRLSRPYQEGQEVKIVYDPDNPGRLDIHSEKINPHGGPFALGGLWWIIGAFTLPGVGLILYSITT
jgi:hypothetical protein